MLYDIERKIFKIEAFIISLSLAVILISVTIQVLIRVLGLNSIGTTEIGMVGMSILTFIGTAAIMYSKDHITIELKQLIKSERALFLMDMLMTLFLIVFCVFFINIAYKLFQFTLSSGEGTLELGIPTAIPIGSMVLGTVLLLFHAVCDVVRLIQTKKHLDDDRLGEY